MYLSILLPCFLLATSSVAVDQPRIPSRSRMKKASDAIFPRADCEPADPTNTVTDRLNNLLKTGGAGYTLSLCPNQNYPITAALTFTAQGQEINTAGLPSDNSRAILTVSGPVNLPPGGTTPNHTTAVQGTCPQCAGVKLRHINGSRSGAPAIGGGANIEMGGPTSGQLIEYVRSFDPRAWSCLHIAEGGLKCSGATVQNNDIGPCGSDSFNQWADGISVACANSFVKNNLVNTPTDGGIVLFGSPGTLVENNTIWVETNTLLGGINMVDYNPWSGNYDGTLVRQNNIVGGLATDTPTSTSDFKGKNNEDAIIKIGIAIGPRIWFGNRFLQNVSHGGIVQDNRLEGAFGYGIAVSSARNFTIQNNQLVGNTTFIGSRGPNCSSVDQTPSSQAFVIQQNEVAQSSIQSDFTSIKDANSLTCILPPNGGDYWPYGGSHDPGAPPTVPGQPSPAEQGKNGGTSKGTKIGLGVGITLGILFVAALAWLIRKWAIARKVRAQPAWATTSNGQYLRSADRY